MGKIKKSTKEEQLTRKKERERKYREKIKNDPIAYAKAKEKEHERYLRRKEQKKIKSITDLSAREQRQKRKKWKAATAKYRLTHNKQKSSNQATTSPTISEDIDNCLPEKLFSPSSSECDSLFSSTNMYESPQSSSRLKSGRKRVRRDRSSMYRKIIKLQAELKKEKSKSEKFKKRFYRLLNDKKSSPKKSVQKILQKTQVPPKIKQKLLEGEILKSQLKKNYINCNTQKEKQLFTKAIGGKILKKYRMLSTCKNFLPYKMYKNNLNRGDLCKYDRKQRSALSLKVPQSIREFLENDLNSTQCPGKKDTITLKKEKRVKRKLNDSLINLHKKYIAETNLKIGYSTFCRLKPFHIVQPEVNKRDTRLCTKHENFRFMLNKLHQVGIVEPKDFNEMFSIICCNPVTEDCLFRLCSKCHFKQLTFKCEADEMLDSIRYYQWNTTKKSITVKGVEKIISVTEKENVCTTVKMLLKLFTESLPKLMKHEANHRHQYQALTQLKKNPSEDQLVLHIDFSENYACKLNAETQSFHFGGSRRQVTLHTGIIYYNKMNKYIKQGFCTISSSLRHDPCAIWAHLKPIFNHVIMLNPNVKKLHIISDSPTSQYRNKLNFYLFTKEIVKYFPALASATWNYTESGHGKGAPDGIGSIIKQSADKAVAEGNDIPDADALFTVVKERCTGVYLATVSESDITEIEKSVPQSIKPLVGTMKVHQISWCEAKTSSIDARSLSCFNCNPCNKCIHYHIKSHSYEDGDLDNSAIEVNNWVAVWFEDEWFPGEVVEVIDEDIKVNFMIRAGQKSINHFKWPIKTDCHRIPVANIISKISPPYPISSRHFAFTENFSVT